MALRGDGIYEGKRGVYWVRVVWTDANGLRRETRRSLGTTSRREAARRARAVRGEIEANPPEPRKQEHRLSGRELKIFLALDLLEHKDRGVTAMHLHRLESKVAVILRNCDGDTPVECVDWDWLIAYQGRRRAGTKDRVGQWIDRPIRGQTIVREYQAIGRALRIARRRGYIPALPDPWPTVRRDAKDKARSGKLRAPALIKAYLDELPDDARDEIEFALYTGLRLEELKRVRYDMIEPVRRKPWKAILRLSDWATKSREERIVSLYPRAMALVQRRFEADPERETVFLPVDHKHARRLASRRVGSPTTITLRDMRHTFGTLAAKKDPVAAMRALGHKDLKTTELYQTSTVDRTAGVGGAVAGLLRRRK